MEIWKLGKEIGKVRVKEMGGRSIDDEGGIMELEKRKRLIWRIIRKEKDRNIGREKIVGEKIIVEKIGLRDGDKLKIVEIGKKGEDLKEGCEVIEIDEDFRFNEFWIWIKKVKEILGISFREDWINIWKREKINSSYLS